VRTLAVVAVALVRTWTWLYTSGLPEQIRERRRLEIESDVWESQRETLDAADIRVAAHVLWRLLFGMADDLHWRSEARAMLARPLNPARARALIAAGAGALLLAAAWAGTVAQSGQAPPHRRDPRVFVVGDPSQPSPPPPPPQ
jgi:citrate lyase beta subunit